jgi:hypothetical protein
MVLSKRERYVAIACGLAVAVLALDRLVMAPLSAAYAETDADKRRLVKELREASQLQRQHKDAIPKWQEMVKSGMKSDADKAESQVSNAIYTWAQDAGLTLTLVKPERVMEKTKLPEIVFQVTGTGTMSSIAKLLWHVRDAKIPVKVNDVSVSARKEGTDDLSVVVHISTIYAPAQAQPAEAATEPTDESGGD